MRIIIFVANKSCMLNVIMMNGFKVYVIVPMLMLLVCNISDNLGSRKVHLQFLQGLEIL